MSSSAASNATSAQEVQREQRVGKTTAAALMQCASTQEASDSNTKCWSQTVVYRVSDMKVEKEAA